MLLDCYYMFYDDYALNLLIFEYVMLIIYGIRGNP